MTENTSPITPKSKDELEIDLMEYARKLWDARKFLLKVAGIAVVVGVIIALTTPKVYTVNVTLAPESSKNNSSLSNIASMLGVGGLNAGNEADALGVLLYPDVVSSTPFMLDLLDTPVKILEDESEETMLIDYLGTQKPSLMRWVMSLPFRAIGAVVSLFSSDDESEEEGVEVINPFHLTRDQANTVAGLKNNITAKVDKKTGVTTVTVSMQDPMVSAIIADTVITKLQDRITSYRTNKAEKNCQYWEQIYVDRKNEYYKAQQAYATYVDANKNVALQSVLAERDRLQNEVSLAYQVYSNVATQLQLARAKVQEAKPAFAVVEPATVPLRPSGTSRKVILLGVVFLALVGASGWVLFGKKIWEKAKQLNK